MIKRILFLVVLMLPVLQAGRAMHATVDIVQFQTEDKSYVEVFFYILGNSVESTDELPSSVQITYMIMRDTVLAAGDKYNLVASNSAGESDFMDLRRHYLSPGKYSLIVAIKDNHNVEDFVQFRKEFTINAIKETASLSDLQLLSLATKTSQGPDKWTKNNVQCIPLPFGHYGDAYDQVYVYSELYHADRSMNEDFYIKYVIASESNRDIELLSSHKRLTPESVTPLLQGFDISGLTSGQYIIKLGVYTRAHELICENEVLFSRSNPKADVELLENLDTYFAYSFTLKMDADSLEYVLKAHTPKISLIKMEALNYLIKEGDMDKQRKFIHRFWLESDPADPEGAYRSYMGVVDVVDKLFHSGLGYGFETDRGNIFMKYGAPNDVISVEDEMSAPPYEIWVYYNFPVTSQFNVKFLFYSPELANSYDLLHSTCENELSNRAWEQILYSNALTETRSGYFIDAAPVADNFNRRAKEYFTDF